jgi:hypothetical protein
MLLLAAAVLLGILVMHGGLTPQVGPAHTSRMLASGAKADMPGTGAVNAAPTSARASIPMAADGLAAPVRFIAAVQDHSGHTGEICLAMLRSALLLAGLVVGLLMVTADRTVRRARSAAARPRGPPPWLTPPRAPSLPFLCVLRL